MFLLRLLGGLRARDFPFSSALLDWSTVSPLLLLLLLPVLSFGAGVGVADSDRRSGISVVAGAVVSAASHATSSFLVFAWVLRCPRRVLRRFDGDAAEAGAPVSLPPLLWVVLAPPLDKRPRCVGWRFFERRLHRPCEVFGGGGPGELEDGELTKTGLAAREPEAACRFVGCIFA